MSASTSLRRRVCGALIASALVHAGALNAQSQVRTHWGTATGLGWDVVTPGDLNGDGVCDYVANDPVTTFHKTDVVMAWSGKDGALLYSLAFATANIGYGQNLGSSGDLTGDGVPDFMLGNPTGSLPPGPGIPPAPASGGIHIFSGANGAFVRLATQPGVSEFGGFLHHLPDLDGDGLAEYGSYAKKNGKFTLLVMRGMNDSLMWLADGGFNFAIQVRVIPDEDGDGVSELAVADPTASSPTVSGCGAIRIFSGGTGTELPSVFGTKPNEGFGGGFDTIGDVDGDSISDYASNVLVQFPNASIVTVSGATGERLGPMPTPPQASSGFAFRVGTDDVDGDGWNDYLAAQFGVFPASVTSLYLFSAKTGLLLHRRDMPYAPFTGSGYPLEIKPMPDVTGDGIKEWLLADPNVNNPGGVGKGAVEIVTTQGLWGSAPTIGAQTPNSALQLEINAGVPAAGASYFVLMSHTGTSGLTALGVQMPLAYDILTQIGIEFANTPIFHQYFGTLDGFGRATATFDATWLPAAADAMTFHSAALVVQQGSVTASSTNAVSTFIDVN